MKSKTGIIYKIENGQLIVVCPCGSFVTIKDLMETETCQKCQREYTLHGHQIEGGFALDDITCRAITYFTTPEMEKLDIDT